MNEDVGANVIIAENIMKLLGAFFHYLFVRLGSAWHAVCAAKLSLACRFALQS